MNINDKQFRIDLDNARRALAILEDQMASYSSQEIPVSLRIQVENKRQEVAKLEKRVDMPLARQDSSEFNFNIDTAELRAYLQHLDAIEIESLCLDHFPIVYDKFARGLRRDEMINLLLAHCRNNVEAAQRLMALFQISETQTQIERNRAEPISKEVYPYIDTSQPMTHDLDADHVMYGSRIIQIGIFQMFRMADLLTSPQTVKAWEFYDAITNVSHMRRVFNNRSGFDLGGLGILRPVIQACEKYDRFWSSALPDLRFTSGNDCPLCFLPYELSLSEHFGKYTAVIPSLERIGQSAKNIQMAARLRIYSPGTGVIRLGLTVEFEEFVDIATLSQLVMELEDLFFVDPEGNRKPSDDFFIDNIDRICRLIFCDESYLHGQRCWMPPSVEYSFRGETVLVPEREIGDLVQLLHLIPNNQESIDYLTRRVEKILRESQWQKNRIFAVPVQGAALFAVDQRSINRSKRKTLEILGWLSDTHELIEAALYAQRAFIEEIDNLYRTQLLDESWLPEKLNDQRNFNYLESLLRTMLKVMRAIACIRPHLHKQGGSMMAFARDLWLSNEPVDFQSSPGLTYVRDWLTKAQITCDEKKLSELESIITKIQMIPPPFCKKSQE